MNRRKFVKTIFKGTAGAVIVPPVAASIDVDKLGKFLSRFIPKPKPKIGTFDTWIFPVIKNVTPTTLMTDLVSVQPMSLPASQIFYMDVVKRNWWDRLWSRKSESNRYAQGATF